MVVFVNWRTKRNVDMTVRVLSLKAPVHVNAMPKFTISPQLLSARSHKINTGAYEDKRS